MSALLALLLTVPIEDVARDLLAVEPMDACDVLSRASVDERWSFREIVLAPKVYTCRSAAVLGVVGGRPITIRGEGSADWSSSLERGAILFWPVTLDKPAITILAGGTRIEGVKLQSQGPKLAAPGFPAAIKSFARATIRDVSIVSWRVSIAALHVHGNGKAMGTDASLMRVDGLKINGVWGEGRAVYVHGADANAGLYSQISAVNVQNSSSIHDGSQLGNTWIACHVHPSERSETTGGINRSPPYVADGAGARALFLGNYAESGTQPSKVAPPSMWIGGLGRRGVSGGGLVLSEGELRNVRVRSPTIVSEAYDTVGLQRLMLLEVQDGPAEADIDTVEVSYDARLNKLTTPPTPLRSTYGSIVWLWQNRREVLRWSMRVARGEWRPPLL